MFFVIRKVAPTGLATDIANHSVPSRPVVRTVEFYGRNGMISADLQQAEVFFAALTPQDGNADLQIEVQPALPAELPNGAWEIAPVEFRIAGSVHGQTTNESRLTSPNEADAWAIPEDLPELGRKAAEVIFSFCHAHDCHYTGGCRVFYSPVEWQARREPYHSNLLIVCHDGGEHKRAVTMDAEDYNTYEQLQRELADIGVYLQQCTTWYSAVCAV